MAVAVPHVPSLLQRPVFLLLVFCPFALLPVCVCVLRLASVCSFLTCLVSLAAVSIPPFFPSRTLIPLPHPKPISSTTNHPSRKRFNLPVSSLCLPSRTLFLAWDLWNAALLLHYWQFLFKSFSQSTLPHQSSHLHLAAHTKPNRTSITLPFLPPLLPFLSLPSHPPHLYLSFSLSSSHLLSARPLSLAVLLAILLLFGPALLGVRSSSSRSDLCAFGCIDLAPS